MSIIERRPKKIVFLVVLAIFYAIVATTLMLRDRVVIPQTDRSRPREVISRIETPGRYWIFVGVHGLVASTFWFFAAYQFPRRR